MYLKTKKKQNENIGVPYSQIIQQQACNDIISSVDKLTWTGVDTASAVLKVFAQTGLSIILGGGIIAST